MKKILSIIASVTLVMALFCGSFAFADPTLQEGGQAANGLQGNENPISSAEGNLLSGDNDNSQDQTTKHQIIGNESKSVSNQLSANSFSGERTGTVGAENILDISSATVEVKGLVRNVVSGAQLKPEVTLRLNGQVLNEGSDYTLYYNDSTEVPTQAGEYTLIARGNEDNGYAGICEIGKYNLYDLDIDTSQVFVITSAANANLVLDAAKNPPASGANVTAYTSNGGKNQTWFIEPDGQGYYIIRNAANESLALDAAGRAPESGANATAYANNGRLNQRWVLAQDENGQVSIYNAANPNLALDAAGKTPVSGANVSAYTSNGGANQKWVLKSTNDISLSSVNLSNNIKNYVGSALTPDVELFSFGTILEEGKDYSLLYNDSENLPIEPGVYTVSAEGMGLYVGSKELGSFTIYPEISCSDNGYLITSAANANLVLDAAKNPPASGANVTAYTSNGGKNQTWFIEPDGQGYYIIRNAANESLALDAAGRAPESGANATAYANNGRLNQRWVLAQDENGQVSIYNAANPNLALDAAGKTPVSGANVSAYASNGGANQKWVLKSTNDISLSSVNLSNNIKNYVGSALTPDVELFSFGTILEEGKDYSLLYNDSENLPIEPGVYTVSAEGMGLYVGSKELGSFTIYPEISCSDNGYLITSAANANLVLDAAKNPPASGANVTAYTSNGGKNQTWFIEPDGQGYYIIRNAANESLALDAAGRAPESGANATAYANNGRLNQRWVLAQDENGQVSIYNAANPNLALDAAGKTPVSGANVSAYTSNGGANQKWVLKSFDEVYATLDEMAGLNFDAVQDGSYTLYSMLSSHPVADIRDSSTASNANVQISESRALESQVWEISHDENGYVQLKNKNSGKYLGVEKGTAASGANVAQLDSADNRDAKWIFIKNEDNSYTIFSALFTDLVLDVYKGSTATGTNIEIYTALENTGQHFGLIETPAKVDPCEPILDTESYYYINSAANDDMRLDITKASKENRTNVELWTGATAMWQMFRFEYEDGYYRIVSAHSDKVLDVDSNSLVPDSNVIIYSSNQGSDNQLWSVKQNDDGAYIFTNKKNGLVLQVAGNSTVAGANVDTGLAEDSKSSLQSFNLEKVNNLMPTGMCRFTTAINGGLSLDVTGGVTAENTQIEIWNNNNSFAQKWWVQQVEGKDNTYTLQAVCSGKYLTDNNGNAVQSSSVSEESQWQIRIKNGYYILENVATGKVLDVDHSTNASGTRVGTWTYSGANNQLWNQESVDPISGGTYIIRSLIDNSKVMDIANASTANNANAAMWVYKDGGNQKYNLVKNSDGTFCIVNCASGKALDVEKANASAGANVIQYTKSNNANQRWFIEYAGDGGFKIASALNRNLLLGFESSSPSNGSNLCLVKDSGHKSQHFTFETTTYVPPMPADQRAMLNRINGHSSGTQWLIAVDRSTHRVGVFKGSTNNWSLQYYWSCVTGAPGSPTITGSYTTTGFKRTHLTTDSRAIWCTQIWGGYFFHSILASESELGQSLSHGCIRLPYSAASWIYNNINAGTRVVIYN